MSMNSGRIRFLFIYLFYVYFQMLQGVLRLLLLVSNLIPLTQEHTGY